MFFKKTRLSIMGVLIAGILLLLSSGVAFAQLETLETTPPEMIGVAQPQTLDNFEPETLEVTSPATLNSFEAESLEAGGFDRDGFNPPDRGNPEYDRCAQQEGFDAKLKCAQEAVGIASE